MTLDYASDVLIYFNQLHGHTKACLLGGEPTLHPDFVEMCKMTSRIGYDVSITTNGQFDECLLLRLNPEIVSSIAFSVEAADPGIHAKIRGSEESHATSLKRIRQACDIGYNVSIECAVSEQNYDDVTNLVSLAEDLGVKSLHINYVGSTGNALEHIQSVDSEKWINLCSILDKGADEGRMLVYYTPAFIKNSDIDSLAQSDYEGCFVRSMNMPHIFPNGNIHLCPVMLGNGRQFAQFEKCKMILNPDKKNEFNACFDMTAPVSKVMSKITCPLAAQSYFKDGSQRARGFVSLCILWSTCAGNWPCSR